MFMWKGGKEMLFEATFFGKTICYFITFYVGVCFNLCYVGWLGSLL